MTAVLAHSRARGTAKVVLLGIANHDGDGGAWPSIATLARYARVSDRNVNKAIAALVELGELVVSIQAGGLPEMAEYRRPNLYAIKVACPPWCDKSASHRDLRPALERLGTNPVSESTPPDEIDTRPPSQSTSEPPSRTTPKPSKETNLNVSGHPSSPRADRARGSQIDVGSRRTGRRSA